MKTAPFETGERPATLNIRLWEGTGSKHGENMLVVAREGIFQRIVIFEYPGKPALSELPTFKEKEDSKKNR